MARVRLARLTDLAALGDLSRLSQQPDSDARSLGLPVTGPRIGVFSLFRLPLGAFRPNDLLFVYEDDDGHLAGLLRVERDSHRDEWTIVELDAIGTGESGDIRFRLVQHLMREAPKRGAIRFHVACANEKGNVELFMQAGFARYGEEMLLFRNAECQLPAAWPEDKARACSIRPAQPIDALPLARLYSAVTPQPVQRLEAYRLADWERQGTAWRVPRSSLAPILRFADMEAYVQEGPGDGQGLQAFLQVGVAKEEQPHYMKILAKPEADVAPLIDFGLGLIAARIEKGGGCPDRGVLAPVRTYEMPIDRRFEEAGFGGIGTLTLLMKEAVVRVAEPALVPAIR